MAGWDDEEYDEARYKEGDRVVLNAPQQDYRFEDQNNEDGPQNGDVIYGDYVAHDDVLTVVSTDWDNGTTYNLSNDEGWRVWGVPEDELRRY